MNKPLEKRIAEILDNVKVKPKHLEVLLDEVDDTLVNISARGAAFPTDPGRARLLRAQRDRLLDKLDAAAQAAAH